MAAGSSKVLVSSVSAPERSQRDESVNHIERLRASAAHHRKLAEQCANEETRRDLLGFAVDDEAAAARMEELEVALRELANAVCNDDPGAAQIAYDVLNKSRV